MMLCLGLFKTPHLVLRRQIFNGTRLGWDFETWKLRGHQLLIKSAQIRVRAFLVIFLPIQARVVPTRDFFAG
jgi:hypothetical protein